MSRFCFCNCPAGFSADPERHAPDCPGRSGAGKARTPVPATTPALKVSASEELDAVLHWRGKHAQAIKERDALQQRLTAADEQIDLLTPRHTEQPEGKRERFEKWVMATKHPVYGFLDGRSLARGDDRTGYADEYVQGLWVAYLKFGAAQPEGEHMACMPVERCYDVRVKMIIAFNEAKKAVRDLDDALDAAYKSALRYSPNPMNAEQSAPVEVVPDGYCIMPRQLTDENGAKALLLGEFKLLVTKECPECCELEEPTEGCSICDGEGEYGQKHTIPWDQIKFIYSKAVSGLAVKAESTKSR
ncbi:hypothetical protein HBO43_18625 [Pseudomonas veronii]|uniref:Uncharacterized protein n=1 Tax=Pseudomonas veronii TaxID=76761 RepID=A0A7Y1F424_PSEVE|nr:hypothetical protein [Pseudomonas veronii]NMX98613.1 hypothetical protein [Pseudomonas veronii]